MSWAGWIEQIDRSWVLLDDAGEVVKRVAPGERPPYDELDLADRDEVYPEGRP